MGQEHQKCLSHQILLVESTVQVLHATKLVLEIYLFKVEAVGLYVELSISGFF